MSANDRLERELVAWFAETAAPRTPEYTPKSPCGPRACASGRTGRSLKGGSP